MLGRRKRARYREQAIVRAREIGASLDPNDWEKIWALLNEHGFPGGRRKYIYAIGDVRNGIVKIGKSFNPWGRLKTLKTGNAGDLRMWCCCAEREGLSEKEVHKRLKAERISGEWFKLTPTVQGVIDEIRAERRG